MSPEQERWLLEQIARIEGADPANRAGLGVDTLELLRCVRTLADEQKEQTRWRAKFSEALTRAVQSLQTTGLLRVPNWRGAVEILERFVRGGT